MLETKLDTRELDGLIKKLEQAPEVFQQARREAMEQAAPKLLQAVRDHYPADMVLLAESEAPTGDAERDGLICRRLGFYARNGAAFLGYDCALFGVHYKTLCWAEPMPAEEEILRKHQEIYLQQFGRERYDRYIQIPLAPGEEPWPLTDWTEE